MNHLEVPKAYSMILYYTVLCHTLLYHVVSYHNIHNLPNYVVLSRHIVSCSNTSYRTVIFFYLTVSYCTILYLNVPLRIASVPYHTVSYCIPFYHTILFCFTSFHTVSHCNVLQLCTVLYSILLYSVVPPHNN